MRNRWFTSLVLAASAILFSFTGCSSPQLPREEAAEAPQVGLKAGIAGTYLAITEEGGRILQIQENGNLSLIMAEQFIGKGARGESYSNTMGSWVQKGRRKVAAVTLDLSYYSHGNTYMGVAKSECVITFNETFSEATMSCEGRVYPPETDPLSPGAQAIRGAHFVWESTHFRRVTLP